MLHAIWLSSPDILYFSLTSFGTWYALQSCRNKHLSRTMRSCLGQEHETVSLWFLYSLPTDLAGNGTYQYSTERPMVDKVAWDPRELARTNICLAGVVPLKMPTLHSTNQDFSRTQGSPNGVTEERCNEGTICKEKMKCSREAVITPRPE